MPTDEEVQQYRRAREVLDGAGWVFDAFVESETRKWLTSAVNDPKGREEAYTRARVATELKLALSQEVTLFEDNKKLADQREHQREQRIGGHNGRDTRPN